METRCECGHVHCCHKETLKKPMVDEESGRPFTRESCAECGIWLSDEPS